MVYHLRDKDVERNSYNKYDEDRHNDQRVSSNCSRQRHEGGCVANENDESDDATPYAIVRSTKKRENQLLAKRPTSFFQRDLRIDKEHVRTGDVPARITAFL